MIDAVLLASAIALTVFIQQYPFVDNWLTVKFFLLIVYIVLAHIAFKKLTTTRGQVTVGIVAIVVFGLTVLTAITRQPFWQLFV
ncbi:MAG: hypothetical protein BMS9Abin15_0852 [Gammaproteobacteria bacterium]|nr:MAG: hypothetical protein BMS9Abin15_0852 [Gammaproteobacteria bacterium]